MVASAGQRGRIAEATATHGACSELRGGMRLEFAAASPAGKERSRCAAEEAPCRVSPLAAAAAEAETARRKGTDTAIGFTPAAAPGHKIISPTLFSRLVRLPAGPDWFVVDVSHTRSWHRHAVVKNCVPILLLFVGERPSKLKEQE